MSWQAAVVEFEKQRSNRKNWYSVSEGFKSVVFTLFSCEHLCRRDDVSGRSTRELLHGVPSRGRCDSARGLVSQESLLLLHSREGVGWAVRRESLWAVPSSELWSSSGTLSQGWYTETVYWQEIYFKEYCHGGGVTLSLSPYTWQIKNFEHYCCC